MPPPPKSTRASSTESSADLPTSPPPTRETTTPLAQPGKGLGETRGLPPRPPLPVAVGRDEPLGEGGTPRCADLAQRQPKSPTRNARVRPSNRTRR